MCVDLKANVSLGAERVLLLVNTGVSEQVGRVNGVFVCVCARAPRVEKTSKSHLEDEDTRSCWQANVICQKDIAGVDCDATRGE